MIAIQLPWRYLQNYGNLSSVHLCYTGCTSGVGSNQIHVVGPIKDVNQMLSNLVYELTKDWNSAMHGHVSVQVDAHDSVSNGASAQVWIDVIPVNDPPVVSINSNEYIY